MADWIPWPVRLAVAAATLMMLARVTLAPHVGASPSGLESPGADIYPDSILICPELLPTYL